MSSILLVTLPFFALVFCGYFAARKRWIPTGAVPGLNAFVLYFALPCMLFKFGLNTPWKTALNPALLSIYLVAGLTIVFLTVTLTNQRKLTLRDASLGALVAAFPNSGFMGFPLLTALLGPEATGPIITSLLVDLIIISTICIALARLHASRQLRWPQALQRTLASTLSNPLPWSVMAGFAWSLTGLSVPPPLQQGMDMLANAASPVALFTIGAVLWRTTQLADDPTALSHIVILALVKLIVHPLLVLMLGILAYQYGAPISVAQIQVLTLVAALPSASNVAILAERYYANTGRIARVVMISTVLSFVTFSLIAWAFQVEIHDWVRYQSNGGRANATRSVSN